MPVDMVAYSHTSMPVDAGDGSTVPSSAYYPASSLAGTNLVHHQHTASSFVTTQLASGGTNSTAADNWPSSFTANCG